MLQLVLAIIQLAVPAIGDATAIGAIIAKLVALVPLIEQEARDLLPIVENIITALSANPATDADQLASLRALDKRSDDDFDAAFAAYNAARAAPAA